MKIGDILNKFSFKYVNSVITNLVKQSFGEQGLLINVIAKTVKQSFANRNGNECRCERSKAIFWRIEVDFKLFFVEYKVSFINPEDCFVALAMTPFQLL